MAYHSVNHDYLRQLAKSFEGKDDPESQGFSSVLSWARNVCSSNKLEGGMVGAFSPNLVARIEGLAEKTQIELPSVNIETISEDNQKLLDEVKRMLNDIDNEP